MAKGRIGQLARTARGSGGKFVRLADDPGEPGGTIGGDGGQSGNDGALDPEHAFDGTGGASGGTDTPRRKGGWPKGKPRKPGGTGTTTRAQAAPKVAIADTYAQNLIILTGLVAGLAKVPEIELTDDEGQQLGRAIKEVQKHFPIIPIIEPKWLAIGALIGTVGKIGKDKVRAINARKTASLTSPPGTPVASPFDAGMNAANPTSAGQQTPDWFVLPTAPGASLN